MRAKQTAAAFCLKFHVTEGPNASDQTAFSVFHALLVEVQMSPSGTCITAKWRLGLGAALVA